MTAINREDYNIFSVLWEGHLTRFFNAVVIIVKIGKIGNFRKNFWLVWDDLENCAGKKE